MKNLLYLILFLIPLTGFAQEEHDRDSILNIPKKITDKDLRFINGDYEEVELKLNFEMIGEESFLDYKNNYDDKINLDNPRIRETDFSFFVNTNVGEFQFRHKEEFYGGGHNFYYYLGYLKPLDIYLISSEGRMYETILSVDSFNGEKLTLFSFSTRSKSGVCISKNERQLLFYAASNEGIDSEISIYHLERKTGQTFSTEEWNIDGLVWIDENSFALQVYETEDYVEEKSDFVKKGVQYLKATIVE